MEPGTQHRIAFEQCFNFRDLGGYHTQGGGTIRWRRLFRSDTPYYMTDDDLKRAREELGIVTVIDLQAPARAQSEVSQLSAPPATYHHLPIFGDGQAEEFKQKQLRPNAQGLPRLVITSADLRAPGG
jgi:protein tyrosine/serine phosphatase